MELDIIRHSVYGSSWQVYLRNLSQFLMSFGLFIVGVGLKYAMKADDDHYPYKRKYSFLLVGGVSFTLLFLNLGRFTNAFFALPTDPYIYVVDCDIEMGKKRRYFVWTLQCVLSVCLVPLALTVGPANGEGFNPPKLLACLVSYVVFMFGLDLFSRASSKERELMRRKIHGLQFSDLVGPDVEEDACPLIRPRETTASETLSTGSFLLPKRSGKELWALVRQRVETCAYTMRVARALHAEHEELMRPGIRSLGGVALVLMAQVGGECRRIHVSQAQSQAPILNVPAATSVTSYLTTTDTAALNPTHLTGATGSSKAVLLEEEEEENNERPSRKKVFMLDGVTETGLEDWV